MWMAAGFLFLESGLVTTRSVSTIAAKNIGKFAIVSIVFYLFGYNMGYGIPEGDLLDHFQFGLIIPQLILGIQMLLIGFFKHYLFVQQFP